MKTPEDEAFDDLAKKQGAWGGGFKAKRAMAAEKLQEPVHCQCEACINGNIHDSDCSVHSDGDALPFGPCDCRLAALAQPEQEPVALHEAVISAWSLREVYFDEEGIPSMHRSPPQPSEEWPGQSNIESPHNACQHRGYCKQMKKQPAQEPEREALKLALEALDIAQGMLADLRSRHQPVQERPWVGLTEDEMSMIGYAVNGDKFEAMRLAEAKLRSKNT